MIQIYHNSRCGKSRNCLAFVENSKKEFEVINYLINPPSFEELSDIIEKLNIKPIELVRQKEKIWIENFKDQKMNDEQIIQAMISNPILIERPIVIMGNKAIIGRDLEKVAEFIS
jgi:arsenate reductase